MVTNRRALTVGVAMAAVVITALGVGIGTADASTRGSWWGAKPHKTSAAPVIVAPKPSASSATPKPTVPAATTSATPAATKTTTTPAATKTATPGRRHHLRAPARQRHLRLPDRRRLHPARRRHRRQPRPRAPARPPGSTTSATSTRSRPSPDAESWWKTNHPDLLLRDAKRRPGHRRGLGRDPAGLLAPPAKRTGADHDRRRLDRRLRRQGLPGGRAGQPRLLHPLAGPADRGAGDRVRRPR